LLAAIALFPVSVQWCGTLTICDSAILIWRVSVNWSTRGDLAKWTGDVQLSQTMPLLSRWVMQNAWPVVQASYWKALLQL